MYFEAVLNLRDREKEIISEDTVVVFDKRLRASVFFYPFANKKAKEKFVRIQTRKKIQVKWKDRFMLNNLETDELIAEGKVLIPEAGDEIPEDLREHEEFLKQLNKNEDSMIFALAKKKGFQGLGQKEISDFSGLSKKQIITLCQWLEQEKKVRIVSFNPIMIIPRMSLDLFGKKIIRLIKDCCKADAKRKGLSVEEIKKSLNAHPKVVDLTINYLKYLNRINEKNDKLALSSPSENISKADERILRKMEEMCKKGEFKKYSFEKLQDMFGVSSERFDRLFDILLRRRKVVHGKDGFIFFSDWLDQLISFLQESGSKEITVAEFKKMSGLSRKYAIPLLELLNEKGVIRREGSVHKILSFLILFI
ncbi:MAG: SelB C-terminal domain-containing protein [Candidatus Aminicenantes bacterium]